MDMDISVHNVKWVTSAPPPVCCGSGRVGVGVVVSDTVVVIVGLSLVTHWSHFGSLANLLGSHLGADPEDARQGCTFYTRR